VRVAGRRTGRRDTDEFRLGLGRDAEVVALDDGIDGKRGACFALATSTVAAVSDQRCRGECICQGFANAAACQRGEV
jgi:hypothetical protein